MNGKRGVDAGALFSGLVLIGLGIIFLLGRLDLAHFPLHVWWPMFLVLFGVARILSCRNAWSGLLFIVIGSWLQVVKLHLFDLTFESSWPLLLIGLGAVITLGAFFDAYRRRPPEERHGT